MSKTFLPPRPPAPPRRRSSGGSRGGGAAEVAAGTAAVTIGCATVLALFAFFLALRTLIVLAAWNLGVAAVTSADKIGFWTAFGISLAIGLVSSIFKRGTVTTTKD